jgi:hypothetical protein
MAIVTEFVQEGEALRLGGNPQIADNRPPAEITTAELASIKENANATMKGDTGITSMEDTDPRIGIVKNAANHYAAYLIRTEWTDKGEKLEDILKEYLRLVESIKASETVPSFITQTYAGTTEYKSHGLNPDVDPYFSYAD